MNTLTTSRFAATIPLNYEVHQEHSLLFLDLNWEELVELLCSPKEFFQEKQALWGEQSVPWSVPNSVTVILEPALLNPELNAALHAADRGGETPPTRSSNTWEEFLIDAWRRDTELRKGFFFVEYAIRTSIVTISYMPPYDVKIGAVPPPKRDFGEITKATISTMDFKGISYGTVHFDLYRQIPSVQNVDGSPVTPLQRANFIVSMLESREDIARRLSEEDGFVFKYDLVSEGETIVIPDATLPGKPSMRFTTPGAGHANQERHCAGDFDLPRVVAEDVPSEDEPYPCVIMTVTRREGPAGEKPKYVLGKILGKSYWPWD